jgi:hypothetical protein
MGPVARALSPAPRGRDRGVAHHRPGHGRPESCRGVSARARRHRSVAAREGHPDTAALLAASRRRKAAVFDAVHPRSRGHRSDHGRAHSSGDHRRDDEGPRGTIGVTPCIRSRPPGTVTAIGTADPPEDGVSHPTFAALFCAPPIVQSSFNAAFGVPGLGRLELPIVVHEIATLPAP